MDEVEVQNENEIEVESGNVKAGLPVHLSETFVGAGSEAKAGLPDRSIAKAGLPVRLPETFVGAGSEAKAGNSELKTWYFPPRSLVLQKLNFMKFSLTKLRAAFGSNKSVEEQHDSTYTEAIMNDVEGVPFAISNTNVMYAGMSELAGYHYFKTIIIGTFKIKTFKGAKLIINGDDFKLELTSDMLELNSEPSPVPNRNITPIDFEIDEEDLPKIVRSKIQSVQLSAKKEKVVFNIIENAKDEEE